MLLVNKIEEHLSKKIENNELNNAECVKIIEHVGSYLNSKTIANYAKENNLSYNGVKHFRTVVNIFDVKFVIDND